MLVENQMGLSNELALIGLRPVKYMKWARHSW